MEERLGSETLAGLDRVMVLEQTVESLVQRVHRAEELLAQRTDPNATPPSAVPGSEEAVLAL